MLTIAKFLLLGQQRIDLIATSLQLLAQLLETLVNVHLKSVEWNIPSHFVSVLLEQPFQILLFFNQTWKEVDFNDRPEQATELDLLSMRSRIAFSRSCVSEIMSLKKASTCSSNIFMWLCPISGSKSFFHNSARISILSAAILLTPSMICGLR